MNDDHANRIENKIDLIQQDVTKILVVQGQQHIIQSSQAQDLAHHIMRTDLLEQQIRPLENKAAMVDGALKLVGGIAVLAGIIEGIAVLLEYVRHVK